MKYHFLCRSFHDLYGEFFIYIFNTLYKDTIKIDLFID